MRKQHVEEWDFEGNKYKIGESLNDESHPQSIYPIVWFKGKLYKAVIKPKYKKIARIGLWNIYDFSKKPYWTTIDKVYQIIKL